MSDGPNTTTATPPDGPSAGPARGRAPSLGRPVLSFVALVAVLAASLLGLRATGAANPVLDTRSWSIGSASPGQVSGSVEVVNRGLLPLRIDSFAWDVRGLDEVQVALHVPGVMLPLPYRDPRADPSPPDGPAAPFRPFTLGRGETRVLTVTGTVRCPEPGSFDSVRVDVATALGLRRTVEIGDATFSEPPPSIAGRCS